MIQTIRRNGYTLVYSDDGLMIRKKGDERSYPNATEQDGVDPEEYEEVAD